MAGTGVAGFGGDGGPALSAQLRPMRIALDAHMNLFIADTNNHRIRAIAAITKALPLIAKSIPSVAPAATPTETPLPMPTPTATPAPAPTVIATPVLTPTPPPTTTATTAANPTVVDGRTLIAQVLGQPWRAGQLMGHLGESVFWGSMNLIAVAEDGSTMFAVRAGSNVYKSSDKGVTWKLVTGGPLRTLASYMISRIRKLSMGMSDTHGSDRETAVTRGRR